MAVFDVTCGVTVVAAQRAARHHRPDGVYLEVFDARKLRDRNALTAFDPAADSLGSYRVTSHTSSTAITRISMHLGRASSGAITAT